MIKWTLYILFAGVVGSIGTAMYGLVLLSDGLLRTRSGSSSWPFSYVRSHPELIKSGFLLLFGGVVATIVCVLVLNFLSLRAYRAREVRLRERQQKAANRTKAVRQLTEPEKAYRLKRQLGISDESVSPIIESLELINS